MLLAAVTLFALLSILSLWTAIAAFRKRRYLGGAAGAMGGMLFLSIAALCGTISIATQGYRALTREVVAARIVTHPTARQRFQARVVFPDGRDTVYDIAGDQVYVDAHILKWKPIANILGLHTAYELDRIGGRYLQLAEEQDSLRTIFSLKREKMVDMFALRTRYAFFAPFVDAEYGSGTFITADRPMEYEVRVSTSGLLIRPTAATP